MMKKITKLNQIQIIQKIIYYKKNQYQIKKDKQTVKRLKANKRIYKYLFSNEESSKMFKS